MSYTNEIRNAMARAMFETVNPPPFHRWDDVDPEMRDVYERLAQVAYYAAKQRGRELGASAKQHSREALVAARIPEAVPA